MPSHCLILLLLHNDSLCVPLHCSRALLWVVRGLPEHCVSEVAAVNTSLSVLMRKALLEEQPEQVCCVCVCVVLCGCLFAHVCVYVHVRACMCECVFQKWQQ